jgi:glycosyltransferase involved in cell wall biosynthesis
MSQTHSTVSVIIPVYNAERYLRAAIESVLTQTVLPLEIIVVDDGSTDASGTVARRFVPNVRVVTQPNEGPAAARNCGVSLARGDYLAFLDADDLWLPGKLTQQLAILQSQPTVDMVFGQVEQFVSPELPPTERPVLPKHPVMNGQHVGAMLIRRKSFTVVGPFTTQWAIGEFIDWYGRAQAAGLQAVVLPAIVMRRRLHDDNLTRRTVEQRTDYAKILKAHLNAKRAQRLESALDG